MKKRERSNSSVPALWLDSLALLGGLMTPLAFAPFDFSLLIFLSLFCLFYSWLGATPKRAALRGFLFGLGQFGVGTSWIYISIHTYGGAGIIVAGALTCLFVVILALFTASVGFIACFLFKQAPIVSLTTIYPAIWTLIEWCRSWVLNGFPWLQVGYTQLDSALAGFIPIGGIYGESWLVCLIAGLLVMLILNSRWKKLIPVALICLITLIGGYLKQTEWTHPLGKPIKATLLQGNIPQDLKWLPEQRMNTLNLYLELTRKHWDSQIVIWPETAAPAFYHQLEKQFFLPLKQEAVRNRSDLVIGVPLWNQSGDRYYNAMVTLGAEDGFYKKRHLVPFGEYLPLKPVSTFIANQLAIPLSDFSAGTDQQTQMRAAGYPFVASICYEDIYGDESLVGLPKGAYLINVTNDAWFGDSIAPHQHLQMARMRALETGRYMLRATNTGVTAVISPSGKVIRSAPLFQVTTITEDFTPMGGSTPYIAYGDKPFIAGFFIILLLTFTANFRLTVRSKELVKK